ncbi:MAG: hypothetical protein ABW092_20395 [Candidatus Thiodiazotropha sp.]
MRKLATIILLFFFLEPSSAAGLGRVYIDKIDADTSWEGNQTGATPNSQFEISIKGVGSITVSKTTDATFENLPLGRHYLVTIKQDGIPKESFYFKFEDYKCNRLWLYYKELYGTWNLRESSFSCSR